MSSSVALPAGVAKSSAPLITSVSVLDVRTRAYSFSPGAAGHAPRSRPPAQRKSVPGLPRIEPRSVAGANASPALAASARAVAATSPQTCARGNTRAAITDCSQNPLESPFPAASQESMVNGAERGAEAEVEFIRPKKEAMRTLPFLIGRNHHRSGMCAFVHLMLAARSRVRARQVAALLQRAE